MTRDLKIISSSLLLWGFGEGLFIYFQPIYLKQLGADPLQIGWILGLTSLAFTISHLPAGALADQFGRKRILLTGWFIGVVAGLMMFLADSLPVFLLGFILYSFTGFMMSPMQSYVTAAKGSWTTIRALTTVSASFNIGAVIGPALGGYLSDQYGLQIIYGIATGIFVISSLLIIPIHSQPIEVAEEGPRYQNLFKNKSLGGFLLLAFFAIFAMYLSWPLTPIFLQEERAISVSTIGILGSLYASGIVILSLLFGRSNPRLGFIIVQIAVGFSVLSIWRGANSLWFSLGYFLASGFRVTRSLVTAQVEMLVKRAELGLAIGFSETVLGMVMLIAAPLAGWLYASGPERPFLISLGMLFITILASLRYLPRVKSSLPVVSTSEIVKE